MNPQKIVLLSTLIISGISGINGAQAATWNWSYSGAGTIGGSGTFTTNNTSPFVVTGITGNAEGSNITGLYPVGTLIYQRIDNRLFTNQPQLTYKGIGFATEALTTANQAGLVLFYDDGIVDPNFPIVGYGLYVFTADYGNSPGTYTNIADINFQAIEVPEPINVLGSVTGIALFGALTNVLKRKSIK